VSGVAWKRLSLNMLAAFLAGDGLLVMCMPRRQPRLWSPAWSPAPWRDSLRFLAGHPRLTRGLAILEALVGVLLAAQTNRTARANGASAGLREQ
jgi:hypothetical protein